MSDLISRQAAIEALGKDPMGGLNYDRILTELPSAQPERFNPCTVCQEFDCSWCKFRRT